MKVTKKELRETLEANLSIANKILRDPASLADKPQVLIKYMEYRHKAMTMLFELNSEADTLGTLEAQNEKMRRQIKDLEYKLGIYKDKYGDVLGAGSVGAGSLHASRPDGPRRDPTKSHADPVGLPEQLVRPKTIG